jgi:uncharacterized protein (TIGR00106 family)
MNRGGSSGRVRRLDREGRWIRMIAFFTIVPIGKESLSEDVAAVVDLVDRSGLEYRLTAMGTVVEGPPDEVWSLIRKCHEAMRDRARRVITRIDIDDRAGAEGRITGKVEAVERRLGRSLKK